MAGAVLFALVVGLPVQTAGASQASPARGSSFVKVAGVGRAAGSAPGAADAAVLDVVILVDESGSETPAKVADEKQTAGTIVQTMLNPDSRVTVVGFGGVNNIVPDQNPVDVVCQPRIASGANLNNLATCVSKLHRRTEVEGDDTDYAAALGQAMDYFDPRTAYGQQSPAGAIKVILMMTDGGVDVSRDTQQYGTDWQLGEQQAVSQQLALAREYGVQLWPLGFGTDITPQAASYLDTLAKGGAQTACDTRQESEPRYHVVNDPSDALNALDQLYAEAGCLGTSVASPVPVGGGVQGGTLQVTIPPIASNAAISVDRGDSRVQVSYYLPGGQPWTDPSAISGQDSPVEVLHLSDITSAETGTWQIQLRAKPGLASQQVSATAFWQGAVRAVITADPPSANPGQPISVTLSVLGPHGPVDDPSALANLQVQVRVSGDGLSGPSRIKVKDTPAGAGEYEGTFMAPQQKGTLTFAGTAAGYGLYATKAPATVQVGAAIPGFAATVRPPIANTKVQVGHAIQGQISFVNQTGAVRNVIVELSAIHATATMTSPAGPVSAGSGDPPSVPFTIKFDKHSLTGSAWLEVKAVDAADPSIVYSDTTFIITVIKPPGWWAGHWWLIAGIIILALLVGLSILVKRVVHRRIINVRGLIATLHRDGKQMGEEHKALGDKWSDTFRFIILNEEEQTARLAAPPPGSPSYRVKRARRGQVELVTPEGETCPILVGGPGKSLDYTGLELAFKDTRRRAVRWPVIGRARGRESAQPAPPAPVDQGTTVTSPAPNDDEWL